MDIGDFILVETNHAASRFIRIGQSLRFHDKRYSRWNHVALVVSKDGDLVEALTTGVVRSHYSKYKNNSHRVIPTRCSHEDQMEILRYANSVVDARTKYGWATIVGLFFTLIFGSKFVIGRIGSAICSGLVSEALVRSGVIFDRPPYYMMPADLAQHYL